VSTRLAITPTIVFASAVLALAGCGRGEPGKANPTYSRLTALSNVYAGYLKTHKNQPPSDEQEFRKYLESKKDELQKQELTIDDVFVSPRTGRPLKWIYGKLPVPGRAGMRYIAYEESSIDNKRLVLAVVGYDMLDDQQFKMVFPNAS
jgi:hypothetical protein